MKITLLGATLTINKKDSKRDVYLLSRLIQVVRVVPCIVCRALTTPYNNLSLEPSDR